MAFDVSKNTKAQTEYPAGRLKDRVNGEDVVRAALYPYIICSYGSTGEDKGGYSIDG
jgi:hypothetical protein